MVTWEIEIYHKDYIFRKSGKKHITKYRTPRPRVE